MVKESEEKGVYLNFMIMAVPCMGLSKSKRCKLKKVGFLVFLEKEKCIYFLCLLKLAVANIYISILSLYGIYLGFIYLEAIFKFGILV